MQQSSYSSISRDDPFYPDAGYEEMKRSGNIRGHACGPRGIGKDFTINIRLVETHVCDIRSM